MKNSLKWASPCLAVILYAGYMLQRDKDSNEGNELEAQPKSVEDSAATHEELKTYYQRKIARAKQQVVLHKSWKQAYADYEKAQESYNAIASKAAAVRADILKGMTSPEEWTNIPPGQLDKLEEVNTLEQAAHSRLVESLELIRKVKVL